MAYSKALPGGGFISIVPAGSYADPIVIAEVESFDISTSEDTADLENDAGDVIDSFVTKRTVSGSLKVKSFSAELISAVTRGVTVSSGTKVGYQQTAAIPGSVAYTVQVTNYATFTKDLGVINLTTGKPMKCADAAADATSYHGGSYTVSSGTYTFHSAQATNSVLISYEASATTMATATVAAASSSTAQATYGLHLYQTGKASKNWGWYFPKALINGFSLSMAKGAWSDVTLPFKATMDTSGNLYYFYSGGE